MLIKADISYAKNRLEDYLIYVNDDDHDIADDKDNDNSSNPD